MLLVLIRLILHSGDGRGDPGGAGEDRHPNSNTTITTLLNSTTNNNDNDNDTNDNNNNNDIVMWYVMTYIPEA